jgi:hypothetical protein
MLGALALVMLAAPRAEAETPLEAIRLVYEAAAGCPSEDAFEAEVRRSAPGFRVTARDEEGRRFIVLLASGDRARGRLTIASEGGVTGARDVEGASCGEVASVLAFAVALAVDPAAIPPESPIPAAAPPAPPAPSALIPARPSPPRPERRAALTDEWWGVSVHGLAATALAPNVSFGGGASADLGARLGPLLPTIRLGLEYATSDSRSVDDARITFADLLTSVEACPTTWSVGPLSLRPCLRVGGGLRLLASAGIPGAHTTLRPWLDLGPMLHLRVRVAGALFADLGGAGLFNAVQDQAFLVGSPVFQVHNVPPFAVRGEVAVGVEFR